MRHTPKYPDANLDEIIESWEDWLGGESKLAPNDAQEFCDLFGHEIYGYLRELRDKLRVEHWRAVDLS